MNVLSLFAGIGGLDLGLERAGMTVVGQVEIDAWCRRVLAKHWPEVPRHDDVRTATDWWLSTQRPAVDVIAGGFPCQEISNAGRQAGIDGERSGLWKAMRDTIRDLRPAYVLLENVSALVVRGLDVVVGDLAEVGYDARWDCVPASAVGAPHRRDRWWCLATDTSCVRRRHEPVTESGGRGAAVAPAHGAARVLADTDGEGQLQPRRRRGEVGRWVGDIGQPLADADSARLDSGEGLGRPWPAPVRDRWWAPESRVGRAADGLPAGMDRAVAEPWERGVPRLAQNIPDRAARLRGLGNAVVPQVAEHVGRILLAATAGGAHE